MHITWHPLESIQRNCGDEKGINTYINFFKNCEESSSKTLLQGSFLVVYFQLGLFQNSKKKDKTKSYLNENCIFYEGKMFFSDSPGPSHITL